MGTSLSRMSSFVRWGTGAAGCRDWFRVCRSLMSIPPLATSCSPPIMTQDVIAREAGEARQSIPEPRMYPFEELSLLLVSAARYDPFPGEAAAGKTSWEAAHCVMSEQGPHRSPARRLPLADLFAARWGWEELQHSLEVPGGPAMVPQP